MPSRFVTPLLILIAAVVVGIWALGGRTATEVAEPAATEDKTAENARRAKLAAAKAEQKALLDRARALRTKLEKTIPEEMSKWKKDVEPLLSNEAGRAIAGSAADTAAFFREYDAPRPSAEDIASLSEQLSFLHPPLEQAYKDQSSDFLPDEAFKSKLTALEGKANDALDAYKTRRERILAIARIAADHPNPTGPTLPQAQANAREASERDRVARDHAREEEERRAALERDERQAALEREERKKAEEEELDRKRRELERKRQILANANDPVWLDAFSPFLALASTRVGGGKYLMGEHPAAYADIQKKGGFQSQESLKFLIIHPDGGMGRRKGKKQGWEEAVRRFPDFEDVARIWVGQCKLLASAADAGKACTPKIAE